MSESKTEEHTKPEFGASGRKIVYDENGKPYVLDFLFFFLICQHRLTNTQMSFM